MILTYKAICMWHALPRSSRRTHFDAKDRADKGPITPATSIAAAV
jgi:hypothetical protein